MAGGRAARRFAVGAAAAILLVAGLPGPAAVAQMAPNAGARQLIPCAVPSIGDYTVLGTVVVDTTTLSFPGLGIGQDIGGVAVFGFDTLTIPSGSTLRAVGSRPLALVARSNIVLNGQIDGSAVGQTPGPGAGGGGSAGSAGGGPGAGQPGAGDLPGGGGAGFGGAGGNGGAELPGDTPGAGGPAYGSSVLSSLVGGSGGGGGPGTTAAATGGGGGGAIALVATTRIDVGAGAVLRVDGATGGNGSNGAGGGGSGGALVLRAPQVNGTSGAIVSARGGNGGRSMFLSSGGGGGGAGGRVVTSSTTGAVVATVTGGLGGLSDFGDRGDDGGAGTQQSVGYKLKVTQALPAVFNNTAWKLGESLASVAPTINFTYGTQPMVPLFGDWDGDGVRTAGSFEGGVFRLLNQNATPGGAPDITFIFGDRRGFPVAGDWNGDGLDDVAVYRNGTWQTRLTGCETTSQFTLGAGSWPGTVPVAGDWDGDGITGVGVYTPSTGTWVLRPTAAAATTAAPDTTVVFPGVSGHYPVTGDWNADGTDTIGVKVTAGTTWYLRNSNTSGTLTGTGTSSFTFGAANELPMVWGRPPAG